MIAPEVLLLYIEQEFISDEVQIPSVVKFKV